MNRPPAMSYFRKRAAEAYRGARASLRPHLGYEALLRLGDTFKAEAVAAAARLARIRGASSRRREAERRDGYHDSRE